MSNARDLHTLLSELDDLLALEAVSLYPNVYKEVLLKLPEDVREDPSVLAVVRKYADGPNLLGLCRLRGFPGAIN